MSDYTPTTEEVRQQYKALAQSRPLGTAYTAALTMRGTEFDRWLAAHDAEVLSAERERIIQDMQERSHPDDWGVPCIYVKSYADRLRGEAS